MVFPTNTEDLLNKREIEADRTEFEKGWNPDKIYRSAGALASDFADIGGGYTLVGVEEENGSAPIVFETDGVRMYFLTDIPCHPESAGDIFRAENLSFEKK